MTSRPHQALQCILVISCIVQCTSWRKQDIIDVNDTKVEQSFFILYFLGVVQES